MRNEGAYLLSFVMATMKSLLPTSHKEVDAYLVFFADSGLALELAFIQAVTSGRATSVFATR